MMWEESPYRSRISSNVSAWAGTLLPFVVTRCRGIGGVSSVSSCSSSTLSPSLVSSSSSSLRFFPLGSALEAGSAALRLAEPPWAYLKKSSSGGSSPCSAEAEVEALGCFAFFPW